MLYVALLMWFVLMGLGAFLWWRHRSTERQSPPMPEELVRAMAGEVVTAPAALENWGQWQALADTQPLPEALQALPWGEVSALPADRREQLIQKAGGIPRPPRGFQRLISTEFIQKATSADLSELLMKEPVISAKVLATVNSSAYALKTPIAGLGQAVTFLGMNTVRSICLQSMISDAFKAGLAQSQPMFDTIWKASALANELCIRLGKTLRFPNAGEVSTQVILSWVGPLAFASFLPVAQRDRWLNNTRIERLKLESSVMGINTVEFGGMLLREWALPDSLVEGVVQLGRTIVTPAVHASRDAAAGLALGHLCIVIGERLALGQLQSLKEYDIAQDFSPEMHHVHGYLSHPALQGLREALQGDELSTFMTQMLAGSAVPQD